MKWKKYQPLLCYAGAHNKRVSETSFPVDHEYIEGIWETENFFTAILELTAVS